MSKPEYWDGYAYPESSQKVWISFSSGQHGDTIIWISKARDKASTGSQEILVYRAVTGGWANRDDVEAEANDLADKVISELGL